MKYRVVELGNGMYKIQFKTWFGWWTTGETGITSIFYTTLDKAVAEAKKGDPSYRGLKVVWPIADTSD